MTWTNNQTKVESLCKSSHMNEGYDPHSPLLMLFFTVIDEIVITTNNS